MSEHGGHFGVLVGNWPVASKLEGGEFCKQAMRAPHQGERGFHTLCCEAAGKQESRGGLRAAHAEHPAGHRAAAGHRDTGHRVLAQAALASCSCRVSGVILPVWAQISAGEPGSDFNSFLHCSGSLQT